MITERFLNSCFSVLLNQKAMIKRNKVLYRDILAVLDFYNEKDKGDIPVAFKTKYDCLKKMCDMLMNDKSMDNTLDSLIVFGKKFETLKDFIDFKQLEELNQKDVTDVIRQIRLRKKLNSLLTNHGQLKDFLEQLQEGTFDSIDDLVEDYEVIVKTLYSNMMTEARGVSVEASASLDLVDDNYDHMIEVIKKKYERKITLSTGYPTLDNYVMDGGFEPSRLYIIAGAPGAGKSTLTNNFIINGAMKSPEILDFEQTSPAIKNGINRVFVYITLENSIEESFMRTYQCQYNMDKNDFIREMNGGVDQRKRTVDDLKSCGSTIIMKYFPAMSISSLDIAAILDDVISEYGKDALKGLYIDYLDLMKTDTHYDLYRIELGHVTLSMKTLAVEYNIPVIMPTQLGRGAYRIQKSMELNLDQVGESVKKIEHADFVMMIAKDPRDPNKVWGRVGKNRSGRSNVDLQFNVDFKKYKFLTCNRVTNDNKPDGTTPSESAILLKEFSGLDAC